MAAHAKYSPSSMKRLLACAGSAVLSAQIEDPEQSGSSIYAAEGTLIHAVSEARLNREYFGATSPLLALEVGDDLKLEGHWIVWDLSMEQAAQDYIDYIKDRLTGDCELFIEQRVKLTDDVWGTADCLLWNAETRHLDVIDLKGGRGVLVDADSDQLLVYALAAVKTQNLNPLTVTTHIVQPRARDPEGDIARQSEFTYLDLLDYEDRELTPGLERLRAGDMTLRHGDHCRFCPAKARCPELAKLSLETARMEFDSIPPPVASLSEDELSEIMDKADVIIDFLKAVQAEISGRLDRGVPVSGWKLVPKRALRKWTDEAKVYEAVEAFGLDMSDVSEPKLLTCAQFEKRFPDIYAGIAPDLVVKESSGTTLARESDARTAAKVGPRAEFEKIA